jgi:hypothetical protein
VILDRDWNLEMLVLPALAGAASLAAALVWMPPRRALGAIGAAHRDDPKID